MLVKLARHWERDQRNRPKKNMTNLHHFNSDGRSEEDISIMPIEEITTSDMDMCRISAKQSEKEDYWCREIYVPFILMG